MAKSVFRKKRTHAIKVKRLTESQSMVAKEQYAMGYYQITYYTLALHNQ